MNPRGNPTLETGKGKAPHLELGLSEEDLLELYSKLLLARMVDERTWALNRQGKINFVISCQGQEAIQVGSAYALRRGVDFVLPYYRDIGVVLVLGMTARELMLSSFARDADPASAGRQMPGHFGYPSLRIITGSSPVATQLPHAVGIALASKIKKDGAVTIVYFGDGSSSQGDVHEAMNFAGVHRLPVVFVCENNGYAISVPQRKQMAIENVADRSAGYGFPGVVVDGNELLAVYKVTREAVDRARCGEGPTLIEAKTYRLTPHSSDDDDRRYRSREEVEEWRRMDPLARFKEYLLTQGVIAEETDARLREKTKQIVDDAVQYAEASPPPRPETLTHHVYASGGSRGGSRRASGGD